METTYVVTAVLAQWISRSQAFKKLFVRCKLYLVYVFFPSIKMQKKQKLCHTCVLGETIHHCQPQFSHYLLHRTSYLELTTFGYLTGYPASQSYETDALTN